MSESTDIKALLKAANPSIQQYVSQLEAENLKLHKQIAKLQVKEVSSNNRVIALEEQFRTCFKSLIHPASVASN